MAVEEQQDHQKHIQANHFQHVEQKYKKEMHQKKEKYKSLWGDEEEKEYDDPREVADNAEAAGSGPEIVDAAATIASVTEGE